MLSRLLLSVSGAPSCRRTGRCLLAADEAALGITTQYNYTKDLADELFRLADANGKVQEADQARVEYILGELAEATGEEYRLVDGTIQKYDKLKNSIHDVIAAKQAELVLGAYQEAYTQALIAVDQKYNEVLERSMAVGKLKMDLDKAVAENAALQAEYTADAADGLSREEAVIWGQRLKTSQESVNSLKSTYDEEVAKLHEVQGEYETYSDQIATYTEAETLLIQGKSEEAIAALNRKGNGFIENAKKVDEATQSNIQAAEDEVVRTSIALGLLEEEYKEKHGSMTEAQKKEMEARIEAAKKEAQDARAEYYRVGGDSVEGLVEGAVDKDGQPQWNLAGKLAGFVKNAIAAARKAADSHSPSRETMSLGEDIIEGLIVGVEDKRKDAVNAFSSATEEVISGIEKELDDGIKKINEKMEELETIRTASNSKSVDDQKQVLEEEKKALEERKKAFADIEKALADVGNNHESHMQSIIGSLSQFEEAQKGKAVSSTKLTKKVRKSIEAEQIEAVIKGELSDAVLAENARYGFSPGVADNGMAELARAVGVQSAGINSLVQKKQSIANARPIVMMLNGRELGRAVVDVGAAETVRTGVKVTGGAK